MKINDTSNVTRFDFKVSPTHGDATNTHQRSDEKETRNLPALTDRPAAVLDINAPVVSDKNTTDSHDPAPGPDPEAANRRRIARMMIGLDVDVKAMTPRDASEVGLQLYAEGLVTWDEYAEFAFQPELHPAYNQTIGALLGETATPDQPRDFVKEWDNRLDYEQRYNAIDSPQVKSTQRIAAILARLAGETTRLDV